MHLWSMLCICRRYLKNGNLLLLLLEDLHLHFGLVYNLNREVFLLLPAYRTPIRQYFSRFNHFAESTLT
jgi:hypothetical protein